MLLAIEVSLLLISDFRWLLAIDDLYILTIDVLVHVSL